MPLLVQSKTGAGTSVSFAAGTTAGNCVTAAVGDTNTTAPSVTAVKLGGAAGNFAAAATATSTSSIKALCTIWADPNCAGSQTAVAVTMSNSSSPVIVAYEFSGCATSSVVDVTHTGIGTAASWSSGATATTTQAAEAWIGACCVVNTAPTGPASPWSNNSQASSTTDVVAGQQVVSSTGTVTYSGTGGGSNGWAAVVVALLPSGASGAGTWTAGGSLTLSGTIAGSATWDAGGALSMPATQSVTAAWDAGGTLTLSGAIAGSGTWDAGGTLTMTGTTQVSLLMDAGGTLSLPSAMDVTAGWDAGGAASFGGAIAGQAAWDAGGTASFGGTIAGSATWDAGGTLSPPGQVGSGLPLSAGGTLTLGATVTHPTVVNQWAATFSQPGAFQSMPPALQSVVVPLDPASSVGGGSGTPSAGNWLFAIAGINEPSTTAGFTVGDADDEHNFWRPGDVAASTWAVSPASALTRTSVWYVPNLTRVPADVYVAPNGACDAYSVLVFEVSGLGPWDEVTGIYGNYAAAATSLGLVLPVPPAQAFLVAAVTGDSTAAGQAFAPAGWTALAAVSTSNGADHTCDAVLTSACLTATTAVSVSASATSASDLSGVIIGVLRNAPSPIPAGANPAWPGRVILEAAFGSGFATAADEQTWTPLTDNAWTSFADGFKRFWSFSDNTGVPYQLGQLQSSNGEIQLDNSDGDLSPSNALSPYFPHVDTGTPLRLRCAIGTIKGVTYDQWYVIQRHALALPEKRNKALRNFMPLSTTDAWSVVSASCPGPYRGEVAQDNPYAQWACDDQPGTGGVKPVLLRNSAPGNQNPLQIVLSPHGAYSQFASTVGAGLASGSPTNALYQVGQNSGWMPGDPPVSPGSAPSGGPVTAQPGSASFTQTGVNCAPPGTTGFDQSPFGYFLTCNDAGFPPLSGGVTVEGWWNYIYLATATAGSTVCQQPANPLTLWEIATASAPVAILQLTATGNLVLITYQGATATSHTVWLGQDLRSQAWFHVAVSMNQTLWTAYLNGGLTAAVSGTAAGMTSAWSWFNAGADMGTGGGGATSSVAHIANYSVSHLAIYPSRLPQWRIWAHYCAAVTGFGAIPVPQAITPNLANATSFPDGTSSGIPGNFSGPNTFAGTAEATIGTYHSGPGAEASILIPSGGASIWLTWQGLAPGYTTYTSQSAGAEQQSVSVTARDTAAIASGYGSGATPPAASAFGDSVSQRLERILGYGKVAPGRAIDLSPLLVAAALDVGGQQAGAGIQAIVDSDDGWLYVDAVGNLCYRARPHLAADTVTWHIGMDVLAGQIPFADDIAYNQDPQRVVNAILATQYSPDGATLPAITPSDAAAAQASQDQYGPRPQPYTSYLQDATEIQAQADWRLAQFGVARKRVDVLTVDAARHPAAWPFVLGANPSDLISVFDAPLGAPATTTVYRICQVSRTISYGANGTQVTGMARIVAEFVPSDYWT